MGKKKERARANAKANAEAGDNAKKEEGAPAKDTVKPRDFRQWALGWIKSIALALVLWFVIQAFLVKSYRIDSGSMESTLYENDFLFINKAVYGAQVPFTRWCTPKFRDPRRGELIVLRGIELDSLTIVKRVIGLAGDTLIAEDGRRLPLREVTSVLVADPGGEVLLEADAFPPYPEGIVES